MAVQQGITSGRRELERFRDPELVRRLLARAQRLAQRAADRLGHRPVIMEVCGTHTVALSRSGLRNALADAVELKSGPGCPVCVTDYRDIDLMLALARLPGVTIATFGDMLRVPGSTSSLERERAQGAAVEVFYSPDDAVALAAAQPERQVVFLGVGFETTAPVVGASLEQAAAQGLTNFSVFSAHKTVPPVMRALLADPELGLDGFLLPGHVSTIIGRRAFSFLGEEYGVPAAITGFEPVDILLGLSAVLAQLVAGEARVVNCYGRVVREEGNPRAQAVIDRCFAPAEASWRGIGTVPESGLALRPAYAAFDAAKRFPVSVPPPVIPRGCRCGELLRGKIKPTQCGLFGRACTPERPVGPCMVSSEGACAAYYLYGGRETETD